MHKYSSQRCCFLTLPAGHAVSSCGSAAAAVAAAVGIPASVRPGWGVAPVGVKPPASSRSLWALSMQACYTRVFETSICLLMVGWSHGPKSTGFEALTVDSSDPLPCCVCRSWDPEPGEPTSTVAIPPTVSDALGHGRVMVGLLRRLRGLGSLPSETHAAEPSLIRSFACCSSVESIHPKGIFYFLQVWLRQ